MLLHYLGKLKKICRYSADMKENANKLHFKCTNYDSSTRLSVDVGSIYVFYQNLNCYRR